MRIIPFDGRPQMSYFHTSKGHTNIEPHLPKPRQDTFHQKKSLMSKLSDDDTPISFATLSLGRGAIYYHPQSTAPAGSDWRLLRH